MAKRSLYSKGCACKKLKMLILSLNKDVKKNSEWRVYYTYFI